MNQQEYKNLNNVLITKLKEKLPDSDIKVVNDPFRGTMVGISYQKGGNLFEIYQLRNNGDEAEYKFLGTGNL